MSQYFKHETAVVDEGAQIGEGSKVWHFCHIMPGAIINADCNLGQNVFIANGVTIGKGSKIQNNVSLYEGVTTEEEVFIGPSAVFTNVINPRSGVVRKSEYKPTLLKKGATVGANATIVCGVTLGQYSFVGAGTVVTKDVPDFALVVGNPSKQIGWISAYGERLHFDKEGRAECTGSGVKYILVEGVCRMN